MWNVNKDDLQSEGKIIMLTFSVMLLSTNKYTCMLVYVSEY